jgi:hypothetical protein
MLTATPSWIEANENREGPGRDLGIERPGVAGRDRIEFLGMVDDHPREHVDAAGGTLRVRCGRNIRREG